MALICGLTHGLVGGLTGGLTGCGGGGPPDTSTAPAYIAGNVAGHNNTTFHGHPGVAGEVGDVLIALIVQNGTSGITMAGWLTLANIDSGTNVRHSILYRVATGTSGVDASDWPNWLTSSNRDTVIINQRFRGQTADVPEVVTSTVSSDPTSVDILTPSTGSGKYTWMVSAAWTDTTEITPVAYPYAERNFVYGGANTNISAWIARCVYEGSDLETANAAANWDWSVAATKLFITVGIKGA